MKTNRIFMKDPFWYLTTKYFTNEASEEDIQKLYKLLEDNPANQQRFEELVYKWNLTGSLKFPHYSEYRAKELIRRTTHNSRLQRKRLKTSLLVICTCLIGLGSVWYYRQFNSSWEEVATTGQQHLKLILPDSTVVWLNQNSSLAYNFSNENQRQVKLEGEAYFEVKRDTSLPFIITGKWLRTRVLGTTFNIQTTEETEKVSVISGEVAVSHNPEEHLLLHRGEQASYFTQTAALSKDTLSNIHNMIAWKEERFDFDNIPIEEALGYLANTYNIHFLYSNESIKHCLLKASFKGQSLKTMLNIICASINCTYTIDKQTAEITLTGEGC